MLGSVPSKGKRGREHRTSADRTSCERRLLKDLHLHAILYGYASIQGLFCAGGNYRVMIVEGEAGLVSTWIKQEEPPGLKIRSFRVLCRLFSAVV